MDHLKHYLTKAHCEPSPGIFIPHEGVKNLLPCKIFFTVGYLSWGKEAGGSSLLPEYLLNSAGDVVTLLLSMPHSLCLSKPLHLWPVACLCLHSPLCSTLPKPQCPDPTLFSKSLCTLLITMGLNPGSEFHKGSLVPMLTSRLPEPAGSHHRFLLTGFIRSSWLTCIAIP